jgi:hypothetical protein
VEYEEYVHIVYVLGGYCGSGQCVRQARKAEHGAHGDEDGNTGVSKGEKGKGIIERSDVIDIGGAPENQIADHQISGHKNGATLVIEEHQNRWFIASLPKWKYVKESCQLSH